MKKTPELPSGGGRYIRNRDGSLKKADEAPEEAPAAPVGKAEATPAQTTDKKED